MTATLDPVVAVVHMLSHPFMAYAFAAGSAVAVATGLVGHFVVLRDEVFAGDALSHVAFTGALGALAFGADLRFGLFGGCVAVGVLLGLIGGSGRADDALVGNIFAWLLGLGVLFLSIETTNLSGAGANGSAGVTVLFGSVFGLSRSTAISAVLIAAGLVVLILAGLRPLTFASVDASVAAARGVPVRALGMGFLALVGVTAGEATQIVGALLLLGLLATPAAAAHRLTDDPNRAMRYAVTIALVSVWVGLTIAYASPGIPPSFGIIACATVIRVGAGVMGGRRGRAAPA